MDNDILVVDISCETHSCQTEMIALLGEIKQSLQSRNT